MASKKKRKTYFVTFQVKAIVEQEIQADSMEDALANADLDNPFKEELGYVDGNIVKVGVTDNDKWNEIHG